MADKKKGMMSAIRTAQTRPRVTEEELVARGSITPEDVLGLAKPCKGYLCKISDNVYKIEFVGFKLRDLDHNQVLVETEKPVDAPPLELVDGDDSGRQISYEFPSDFLRLRTVGATVKFANGPLPAKDFRMIERHFFKDRLIKSFDFNFGFCIPESVNTREDIYELPTLTEDEIQDMVANRFETRSDSFYFVEGKLIMHNRAQYAYFAQ
eukprot:m.12784 g.12784  ORF g.12784 m.12784 type:complete len:209 (-) comp17857_c0_seq1:125-751(-)